MRSGEVARAAGVNLQTLRYYERRGLLPEPERTWGGQRQYPAEAVTVVRVVKALQRLGFTLAEIEQLLALGVHRHGAADDVLRDRLQAKIVDVDRRIADLESIRKSLRAAVAVGCRDLTECAGTPGCPIPFAALAS